MERYISQIEKLESPTFQVIRNLSHQSIDYLLKDQENELWKSLDHGVNLLNSHEQLCEYLWAFGNMHEAKIHKAIRQIPDNVLKGEFDIIDWGCGQGMASMAFLDYVRGFDLNIGRITLIEPSSYALDRACLHLKAYLKGNDTATIVLHEKFLDQVEYDDIKQETKRPVIHFFSNILDIPNIDLKKLSGLINSSVEHDNYIVCVGPLNHGNKRIDAFYQYFNVPLIYDLEDSQFRVTDRKNKTCKIKLYKLSSDVDTNLLSFEYYPPVQFHAAYQLDGVNTLRKQLDEKKQEGINSFYQQLCSFELAAPFDIGASIYKDVHPILAVLNNMVTRGLPTKASPYIEEQFSIAFNRTNREDRPNGDIVYSLTEEFDYLDMMRRLFCVLNKDTDQDFVENDIVDIQFLLSPIAIARLQKTILEAIITNKLDLTKDKWNILVQEHDVPCASLALNDLRLIFNNLCSLSEKYNDLRLPEVDLFVVSNKDFCSSPLHLNANVSDGITDDLKSNTYDLVVEVSLLNRREITKSSFSNFKVSKTCYFNIQSAQGVRSKRFIYTSDKLCYRSLVKKNSRGDYEDIVESKDILQFFLQLLFRKQDFRPGQLPILHRALQGNCVIGLLPTGGGKSLTYQIAAMLQPGVTLIVDPLTSLMKDQYDGLVNAGIDCCSYINSTVEDKEARAKQMERSELLFVFLSPERLAIYNFRERLKVMHQTNVYFAYGVLDEVHCVSEWGHDFRFSYLHLGRNLYRYVKPKEGSVSLFGLTATASFDVLADVERELSGEGAFDLDSETIVRYENTNRLELQYRVEKVKVQFSEDPYFDKGKVLDRSLPRAVTFSNRRDFESSKCNYLKRYVAKVPDYLTELQTSNSLDRIYGSFSRRQNITTDNADLTVEMPYNYFEKKETYPQAGIVFCPHKANTGVSVQTNKNALVGTFTDIGTFFGGDDTNISMQNLELFRDSKQPLMVATKAFGMGIDKPNVRFTVNMNYSSSLESFVQEAGRAGRDRKMALSTILLSDFTLARIKKNIPCGNLPMNVLRNKWFNPEDLITICKHYDLRVNPSDDFDFCTTENDIVRLHCTTDFRTFSFGECLNVCPKARKCKLAKVPTEAKGWLYKNDLDEILTNENLEVDKSNIQHQNADYETVMYFYNNSFKGAKFEKIFMNNLLSVDSIKTFLGNDEEEKTNDLSVDNGFLERLMKVDKGVEVVSFVPYIEVDKDKKIEGNQIDVAKAIYRMTCIELIEDFTQDYVNKRYRIVSIRKSEGEYYLGLNRFLLRYYNAERAKVELERAKRFKVKEDPNYPVKNEIYRCLAYLTDFVYEKISEKRKRAIDDMRNFCIAGIDEAKDWKERNEDLKDFIYYYFNSKYAKDDYIADNGEEYSLTTDTDKGKISSDVILFKYMKVVEDELVGVGTPMDNIKHLQGAVRLIRRSLTDSNPALSLLNAFCLLFLGTHNNKNLEEELNSSYKEGMSQWESRSSNRSSFWKLFDQYNQILETIASDKDKLLQLKTETSLMIHSSNINKLAKKYTL